MNEQETKQTLPSKTSSYQEKRERLIKIAEALTENLPPLVKPFITTYLSSVMCQVHSLTDEQVDNLLHKARNLIEFVDTGATLEG